MTTSLSPIVDASRAACLNWFTGSALVNATLAMDMLAASEAQGAWVPKASRRVMACFTKANVIIKLAHKYGKAIEAINGDWTPEHGRHPDEQRGWGVSHVMRFSLWTGRGKPEWEVIKDAAPSEDVRAAIETARKFLGDFAALAALSKRLDDTRPLPVFTTLGVSPTLTSTLKSIGVDGSISTIRLCPIRWETEEVRVPLKSGGFKICYVLVGYPEWPANTVHNASRHSYGGNSVHQCHACGHAIKQPDNWVPIIIDNAAGVPHSLWIGRDCSRSLFGIKMTGAMTLKEKQAA